MLLKLQYECSERAPKQRQKKAEVPDFYFCLLDAAGMSPTLIPNQNARPKREDAGCFPKTECQKLQRLYTQGGAPMYPWKT